MRESEPAFWALQQDYTAPDGSARSAAAASSRACAWRTTGPGRIRPHERTHPGPEGGPAGAHPRHARQPLPHLQPVPDPENAAGDGRSRPRPAASRSPRPPTTRARGTRCGGSAGADQVAALESALASAELLIADGHHRYETARVYAEEVGGEGEHRYVLMFLCSLSDPGLTVFPTHRLLTGLKDDTRQAGGHPRRAHARLRDRAGLARRARAGRRAQRPRPAGLHGQLPQAAVPADAEGRRRSPTPRWPASPSPTGAWTPRCWRRSCSRARWA